MTSASRNSKTARTFEPAAIPRGGIPALLLLLLLSGLSASAVWWVASQGWTLYYGDAEAHLNIARRVWDSRTPNYWQLGTVWLPLPHLLMLPWVGVDALWRSGLGGAIPAAAGFVIAGLALFGTLRRLSGSLAAAASATAVFALNPNLLYLQSIPMTESLLLAWLLVWLYAMTRYAESRRAGWLIGGALAANAAVLTRYEAWFLLPFSALLVLLATRRRRWMVTAIYCSLLAAGPLYWLAHNWIHWGDALEFYRGPYSAKAIYQRALDTGMQRYPGDHDWLAAMRYYLAAARLAAGDPLFFAGLLGALAALWRGWRWAVLFLLLPPGFYVLSMYSSGTPIFLPHLWPNSYYNTRYGLVMLPLLAVGCASLLTVAPPRWRTAGALLLVGAALAPWLMQPRPQAWVCWEESRRNSVSRRQWTAAAAQYLRSQYGPRDGIYSSFGDLAAILREAGLPLAEMVHDGNHPLYNAIRQRPDLFLQEKWAIAIAGDPVATTLLRAQRAGIRYELVREIITKDSPVIQIYRRVR